MVGSFRSGALEASNGNYQISDLIARENQFRWEIKSSQQFIRLLCAQREVDAEISECALILGFFISFWFMKTFKRLAGCFDVACQMLPIPRLHWHRRPLTGNLVKIISPPTPRLTLRNRRKVIQINQPTNLNFYWTKSNSRVRAQLHQYLMSIIIIPASIHCDLQGLMRSPRRDY